MKFCANCGNQMEDSQRFCPQCGNDTMAAEQQESFGDMTRGAADPNAGQYQQQSYENGGQQQYNGSYQQQSYGNGGQQQYNGGYQQQPYENNSGYQNLPYGGYQQPGVDYRKTNGMGIAALVCSLVGILVLGIVLEPLAIIFGIVCITQCNSQPDTYKGQGLGLAGLIIGIIALILVIVGLVMAGSIAGTILASL